MTDKKLVIANWKMNGDASMCLDFSGTFSGFKRDGTDVVISPPSLHATFLSDLLVKTKADNVCVAGQNCHYKDFGSYTGEISAKMLANAGCKYVILGHSERRKLFSETNNDVLLKSQSALDAGLIPIVCVGETDYSKRIEQIKHQCQNSLPSTSKKIVIAYEPVYSIGTGVVPTNSDIEDAVKIIKDLNKNVSVVYGGSVNNANCNQIMQAKGLDGVLVGGASLKIKDFFELCCSI